MKCMQYFVLIFEQYSKMEIFYVFCIDFYTIRGYNNTHTTKIKSFRNLSFSAKEAIRYD